MALPIGGLNAAATLGVLVAAFVTATARSNAQSVSEKGMGNAHVDVFGIQVVVEKAEGADAEILVEGFLDDMNTPAISERISGVTEAFYRPLLTKFDGNLGPRMLKVKLTRTDPKCKVSGEVEFHLKSRTHSKIIQTRRFSLDDRV